MPEALELYDLGPEPQDEWRRMLRFVGWSAADHTALSRSVAALFRQGPELVAATYDHLRQIPETAAILGWDQKVDPTHLEERRRFFTIWLARTLGLDTSGEFALYLFQAGKYHAGHGPRQIHIPAAYVTGAIGLVLAAFARCLADAGLPAEVIASAMASWNKYLAVQLNQMLLGYHAARELRQGAWPIHCTVFGRMRPLIGAAEIQIHVDSASNAGDVLRKFFNYYPQARPEALDRIWNSEETEHALWTEVIPAYAPRYGWRILLNGRDLAYDGGFAAPLRPADRLAIFPPGR